MENKTGIELIAAERQRQIEVEGWTAEHDASHQYGELAKAAACYANPIFYEPKKAVCLTIGVKCTPEFWPWDAEWWKPSKESRIADLIKAGALVAAEIDRLQASQPIIPHPQDK